MTEMNFWRRGIWRRLKDVAKTDRWDGSVAVNVAVVCGTSWVFERDGRMTETLLGGRTRAIQTTRDCVQNSVPLNLSLFYDREVQQSGYCSEIPRPYV